MVANSLALISTDAIPQEEGLMNRQEAEKCVKLFCTCDVLRRQILLALFERKAHRALNYGRFEDLAASRLNLSEPNYAYDLLRWARVERTVLRLPQISVMTDIGETSKTITSAKLPQRTALLLSKLPSEEMQIAAWEEVKTLERYGTHTPAQVATQLKGIVQRRLNNHVFTLRSANAEQTDAEAEPAVAVSSSATPTREKEPEPETVIVQAAPVALEYVDVEFELRFIRVNLKMPDGREGYALIPKGALK